MYYCGPKKKSDAFPVDKRKVLTCDEEVTAVLQEIHDNGTHEGLRQTQEKINQQYYWLTITHDVNEWVSQVLNT